MRSRQTNLLRTRSPRFLLAQGGRRGIRVPWQLLLDREPSSSAPATLGEAARSSVKACTLTRPHTPGPVHFQRAWGGDVSP